jgi:hypothetical protein
VQAVQIRDITDGTKAGVSAMDSVDFPFLFPPFSQSCRLVLKEKPCKCDLVLWGVWAAPPAPKK